MLQNSWEPNEGFIFPPTIIGKGKKLRFQRSWLKQFEWLLYSKLQDGAFCKYCSLFSPSGAGQQSLPVGRLVHEKHDDWKHALEDFRKHEKTRYHADSKFRALSFIDVRTGKKNPIIVELDKGSKEEVKRNRKFLEPIVKTVIFCGRQGLPLRGHRDSGPLDPSSSNRNEGNFRALLKLRLDAGDENLKSHLEQCGRNASYLSPSVQNEIISECGALITKNIVSRVNNSKYFSLLADETADISGIEQLSLCVRYVDMEKLSIQEDFLKFVPLTEMTGKGISEAILSELNSLGIESENIVGQGYDGASAMSGQFNGVQANIKKVLPNALYVHCSSHSLNLAVSDSCSTPLIRNCLGVMNKVYAFFNTPKRQLVLKKHVGEGAPHLKQLCPTRWVQRHDAVIVFLELFEGILLSLEEISTWLDKDSSSNAQILFLAVSKGEFLLSIKIICKLFSYSLPLSKYLQSENIDLKKAVEYAQYVHNILNEIRRNAISNFQVMFHEVEETCRRLGLSISLPRFHLKKDSEEFYRITCFLPFLDSFLLELNERFLLHRNILESFQVLIPNKESSYVPSEVDERAILALANKYYLNASPSIILGELRLWFQKISHLENKPENALDALKHCNDINIFPTVGKLVQIMATLPVTTCSAERSFSSLRYLKNYLRSTIGENRLNGLALLFVHQDVPVGTEEVLDRLALKSRRLKF